MKIMISHNQAPLSGAGHEMSPTTKVSFVQIHVHLAHIKNKDKRKILFRLGPCYIAAGCQFVCLSPCHCDQ